MKRTLALSTLAFSLGLAGCIVVEDTGPVDDTTNDSTLTIENDSNYALKEIRVTEVDNPSWGPNLMGGDVLLPGESITVELVCNTYDVLVVDQDDFSCELNNLDLCFDDAVWPITNSTLNNCGF